MEADWDVEIGGQAPVIDACWDGLVDLRPSPAHAASLPEARALPALGATLIELNSESSSVWTSKCDVWRPAGFDPDELDAPFGEGNCALACYIDLLPRTHRQWPTHEEAVAACREICALLRSAPVRGCRADLIIRRAVLAPTRPGIGITAYLTACGPTPDQAQTTLEEALHLFATSVLSAKTASKLQ
jgi:hypothetical protein